MFKLEVKWCDFLYLFVSDGDGSVGQLWEIDGNICGGLHLPKMILSTIIY